MKITFWYTINMCLVSVKILDTKTIVYVGGMLVNSDFTLKLAIIKLGSNSSTSLANENECFYIY